MFLRKGKKEKGLTLVEVLIATGFVVLVFGSIMGLFRTAIELVGNNKAKIGALALTSERMELIRSLAYNEVGTISGIPAGNIPQTENITLNGISYTRRVLIQYVDDPKDGTGLDDDNGITTDYKRAKVEVSWTFKERAKSVFLVSNIIPLGLETTEGGGTLIIRSFDALGVPVPAADVHIENSTTSPTISIDVATNANGEASFPGAPAASEYEISVTKTGYSTAQTYNPTAENPNPSPSPLTVVEGQSTVGSFAIDVLSSKRVNTYHRITDEVWTDTFSDSSNIIASASSTVSGGDIVLLWTGSEYEPNGYATIGPGTVGFLNQWQEISWLDDTPASTNIVYKVYHDTGGAQAIIPDVDLAGNSTGFTSPPIDISGVSTTTYPVIYIHAELATSDTTITPEVNSVSIAYKEGPIPFSDLPFNMRGNKTIGTDGDGDPVYKYSNDLTTDGNGTILINDLEWDNYTITVEGAVIGYDISESCEPQSRSIAPNTSITTDLYFAPHANNSLLVDVRDSLGDLAEGAIVHLYRAGYDKTQIASSCGQTFFESLLEGKVDSGDAYSIGFSLGGATTTAVDVEVEGASRASVSIN